MNRKRTIPETVQDYIAGFSPAVRSSLKKIRQTIRKAAPRAKENISYGIPAFTLNGPLIYFAWFKSHIGLYPMTATVRQHFKDEREDTSVAKRPHDSRSTSPFLIP